MLSNRSKVSLGRSVVRVAFAVGKRVGRRDADRRSGLNRASVAVGAAIGAAAMYLLDPEHGEDRRTRLHELIVSRM